MIINCAIIDDEPLALNLLESYINKTSFLKLVGRYSNVVAAKRGLASKPADLLFLDIQMPDASGLEFARTVPSQTRVIFTTAFSQYAAESYRVSALDYLLKPFSYDDFLEACNKAVHWYQSSRTRPEGTQSPVIFVKSERRLICVNLDDIVYIEAMRDYMKIVLEGNQMPIFTLMSMKVLTDLLPAERFIRVQRSYLVQKSKVKLVENNHIVFDGIQIPIGDLYKANFMKFVSETKINVK